eukprot:scaffold1149_cov236-Pinguiococcus_pyrenoidosus.AAC.16
MSSSVRIPNGRAAPVSLSFCSSRLLVSSGSALTKAMWLCPSWNRFSVSSSEALGDTQAGSLTAKSLRKTRQFWYCARCLVARAQPWPFGAQVETYPILRAFLDSSVMRRFTSRNPRRSP